MMEAQGNDFGGVAVAASDLQANALPLNYTHTRD